MSEAPQKKGTSWSIGIGLGIVALLIGTAIVTEPSVSFSSSGNRGCAPAGTETPLRLQTNTLSISAPGIVKASYLTMLSPSVSGKVDKVHPLFNVGEIVLKGTPLMELEKFEYRARLANAQAELEQARLDVSTEQAEALKAIKKTYSSVSKSGKESELVLRVPQRRAVNARLNAAEAYVAEAEQALRDTVLEAPYTCQVVECSVGAGARVVAGQPVGKVIPLQERMIRIPVPLEEFSALPRDEQGKVNTALTASCMLNNGKRLQWLEAQEERIRFFDEHGYTGLMPSAYRKLCDACITFYFRCTDNVEEAAALKKELKDRLKAYEQQGAEWIEKLPARTRMGYKLFEICPAIYGKLLSRMQEAG